MEFVDPLDITTSIVYTRDTNLKVEAYAVNPNNVTVKDVCVRNARTRNTTLTTHGFQLAEQVTSLSNKEFMEDDAKVKAVYYKEMAELVKAKTGCAVAIPFHHMRRSAAIESVPTVSQQGRIRSPAGAAHVDYTARYAAELFEDICPEELRRGRFCIINAWRSISDVHPVRNQHLAVLDARSVVAPDDFVRLSMPNEDGSVTNTYRLDPAGHRRHQWYYFPAMVKNEVLLFTQFDSDTAAPVRYTFHSAIKDSTAPADAPLRESMEMRILALFPNHASDTLPRLIFTNEDFVETAVKQTLKSLRYPELWPAEVRAWVVSSIHSGPTGENMVINVLVTEGAKKGTKALKGATAEQQRLIIARLKETEFVALAKQYFPRT